jgi:hypothetical protein
MPSITLKMAVFAPIPMARVRRVTAVNSGERSSRLRTCLVMRRDLDKGYYVAALWKV